MWRTRLFAVAILTSATPSLVAGINRWTPIGPAGESVTTLAIDARNPSTLYAGDIPSPLGSSARIFRSFDGGLSWDFREVRAPAIAAVALDPFTSSTVFAAGLAFFRSDDSGSTWQEASARNSDASVALAVDPKAPGTLYVAFRSVFFVRLGDSICKTNNGGQTFPSCFPLPPDVHVRQLAVEPFVGGFAYAATSSGIWRSTDGTSWAPLTGGVDIRPYFSVAVDPSERGTLYADGLLVSRDQGEHWEATGVPPPVGRGFLLAVRGISGALFAAGPGGVAFTSDRGATWAILSDGLPGGGAGQLVPDPLDRRTIFATTSSGIFRYTMAAAGAACGDAAHELCLADGRFRVHVAWRAAVGDGEGQPLAITRDAGAFWFFSPNNLELVVKVVDGRAANGKFWVFVGGLTDVEYDLAITDLETGAVWTHQKDRGRIESFADTSAF